MCYIQSSHPSFQINMCHMYVHISGMYVQRWNICYISICGFGKGPIVYSTQRGGGGRVWRRVQFPKRLDFGWGGTLKMHKMWGRSKYVKVVKLYYDWSKSMFPSKVDKKICFGSSLSATKCYPYKAWPRNLSAISSYFSYQGLSVHVCTFTYAYSWNLEKYIDLFNFLKAFVSLNQDKYFALYCCFCVRISFILLLIKWSEIDPVGAY